MDGDDRKLTPTRIDDILGALKEELRYSIRGFNG